MRDASKKFSKLETCKTCYWIKIFPSAKIVDHAACEWWEDLISFACTSSTQSCGERVSIPLSATARRVLAPLKAELSVTPIEAPPFVFRTTVCGCSCRHGLWELLPRRTRTCLLRLLRLLRSIIRTLQQQLRLFRHLVAAIKSAYRHLVSIKWHLGHNSAGHSRISIHCPRNDTSWIISSVDPDGHAVLKRRDSYLTYPYRTVPRTDAHIHAVKCKELRCHLLGYSPFVTSC